MANQATPEQAAQVKRITDNLEATYQSLRKCAANISTLIAANQATCDEIKAYNLYALSVYQTQQGILSQALAAGENVPSQPAFPTLFAWKGVDGAQAYQMDCSSSPQSLSGALAMAFGAPVKAGTKFVGPNEIKIVTQDPHVFDPQKNAVPSLAQLAQLNPNGTLGLGPLAIIVIAAVAFGLGAVAIYEIGKWLTEKDIQEETTSRTKIQADAFAVFTAGRASCYQACVGKGGSISDCTNSCNSLVPKPDIKIDSARATTGLGTLGTVGLVTLAAAVGIAGYLYIRHRGGLGNMFASDGSAAGDDE